VCAGVGGKEQKKSWAAVARAAAEAEAAEGGGGGGDGEEEYVVERLLDTRRRAGVREYHVKWYGYDAEADMTWEMESNLNDLLTDYDGYKEQVWHKLSAVEKAAHAKQSGAQVKAKPLKAKPLKAKPKPKPKAPKNEKEQPPKAKPKAQAKGSRGPKAVSASSSSSAPPDTFPAVSEGHHISERSRHLQDVVESQHASRAPAAAAAAAAAVALHRSGSASKSSSPTNSMWASRWSCDRLRPRRARRPNQAGSSWYRTPLSEGLSACLVLAPTDRGGPVSSKCRRCTSTRITRKSGSERKTRGGRGVCKW
jgi:hypothetical protein